MTNSFSNSSIRTTLKRPVENASDEQWDRSHSMDTNTHNIFNNQTTTTNLRPLTPPPTPSSPRPRQFYSNSWDHKYCQSKGSPYSPPPTPPLRARALRRPIPAQSTRLEIEPWKLPSVRSSTRGKKPIASIVIDPPVKACSKASTQTPSPVKTYVETSTQTPPSSSPVEATTQTCAVKTYVETSTQTPPIDSPVEAPTQTSPPPTPPLKRNRSPSSPQDRSTSHTPKKPKLHLPSPSSPPRPSIPKAPTPSSSRQNSISSHPSFNPAPRNDDNNKKLKGRRSISGILEFLLYQSVKWYFQEKEAAVTRELARSLEARVERMGVVAEGEGRGDGEDILPDIPVPDTTIPSMGEMGQAVDGEQITDAVDVEGPGTLTRQTSWNSEWSEAE
ncbi:hypothetical protein BJ508DRAFT_373656 [Ascobolus immersus RN42]|uniref:Uncharacterized protein n=1 Tax=Ascobolus immersus RN42 TaxID=1160509 RepID=A0A3N4IGK0_ASCIM|nr:hypothetical protein BJ508DRAFT_373656 [Ascobolus immersus RN42]